ncbi:MAG: four helix bundle protein [Flavobacterium sp.]|nr:four helix bundle protein [Pedobacter sp.]
MQNFKDLKAWDKAHQLILQIYRERKTIFKDKVYSLTNQLGRAASSVPANIAEWCGKNSQKDLENLLNIAFGSGSEAGYFLLLAKDYECHPSNQNVILYDKVDEVERMLTALIYKVRINKIQLLMRFI